MALSLYGLIRGKSATQGQNAYPHQQVSQGQQTELIEGYHEDAVSYQQVKQGQGTVVVINGGYLAEVSPSNLIHNGQRTDAFRSGSDLDPVRILGRRRLITAKEENLNILQNAVSNQRVRNGSQTTGGQIIIYPVNVYMDLTFTFDYFLDFDYTRSALSAEQVRNGSNTALSLDGALTQLAEAAQRVNQGQLTTLIGTFTQEFNVDEAQRVNAGQVTELITSGAEQNVIPYNRIMQGQTTDQVAMELWTDVIDDNVLNPEQQENPWIQI